MRAMILAAGRGERMRPLTDGVPKAMLEVAGESLIERHLRMLAAYGIKHVVINLGWLGDRIVERLGGGDRFGLQLIYSSEGDNVLETAGGIQRALPVLGDARFWVINADIFTDIDLADVEPPSDTTAHLVLVATPPHKSTGDFNLVNGLVRNSARPEHTFTGIASYSPKFFADLPPGRTPITPKLRRAADNGLLSGIVFEGLWEDVGTPQRLAELNARMND